MNHLILQWLRLNGSADATKIDKITTHIDGIKLTEFFLRIDYRTDPNIIASRAVYGNELAGLWKFIMGEPDD